MSSIQWDNNYCVCVKEIDLQNQTLFSLINGLDAAARQQSGKEVLAALCAELIDTVIANLTVEERLLDRAAYADVTSHKAAHEKLRSQLLDLRKLIHKDPRAACEELTVFLSFWLKNHILMMDKRFGKLFTEHQDNAGNAGLGAGERQKRVPLYPAAAPARARVTPRPGSFLTF